MTFNNYIMVAINFELQILVGVNNFLDWSVKSCPLKISAYFALPWQKQVEKSIFLTMVNADPLRFWFCLIPNPTELPNFQIEQIARRSIRIQGWDVIAMAWNK